MQKRKRFNFKIGDEVLVSYDGKLGRCTIGIIIAKRKKQFRVRFKPWADDIPVFQEVWFKKDIYDRNGIYYTYLSGDDKLMTMLFSLPGDYYCLYPINKTSKV